MFEPPSLPPAGWYPDPHRPGTQRWWNGSTWHEESTNGAAAVGDRLPDVGAWLSSAFGAGLSRWRATALVALVTTVPASVLVSIAASRLVRGVVIFDDGVEGWSNDRLPVAIGLLTLASVLGFLGTLALTVLMLRSVDGDKVSGGSTGEMRAGWSAITESIRILPRAFGWSMIVMIVFVATLGVVVLVAIAAGAVAVLLVIVAAPFAIYLGVRLVFLGVAIVDRPGQPFGRTMEVTRGRWWAVFGRLLLLGLISWLISAALQTANAAAGASSFGSSSFEVEADGSFTSFELAEAFPSEALPIIVGAVVTLLVAVLVTSIGAAGAAALYRTRNPAD